MRGSWTWVLGVGLAVAAGCGSDETLVGPAGPTGAAGAQGPAGLAGAPGERGPVGPRGLGRTPAFLYGVGALTSVPLWVGTMYSSTAWTQEVELELDTDGTVEWTVRYAGNFGNQDACDGLIVNVSIDGGAPIYCGQSCREPGGVGLLACEGTVSLTAGVHVLGVVSNGPGGENGFTIESARLDLTRI